VNYAEEGASRTGTDAGFKFGSRVDLFYQGTPINEC
jgi:hypothetical protein